MLLLPFCLLLAGCSAAGGATEGHGELVGRGAERVDLQLGHLLGRYVGVQLAEELGDGDGARVVGQDDYAVPLLVE